MQIDFSFKTSFYIISINSQIANKLVVLVSSFKVWLHSAMIQSIPNGLVNIYVSIYTYTCLYVSMAYDEVFQFINKIRSVIFLTKPH